MRHVLGITLLALSAAAAEQPNVLVIMADDLGYGDLSCYNPESQIQTPALDRLAAEGMRFTDAHANAAQCSPTRYGLLTGRYAWRTRMKQGVLPHFAKPLIDEGRVTLASLLKEAGYATAGFGKWHLGWGWQAKDGMTFDPDSWSKEQLDLIDFRKPLTASPNDHGFDYYFGIGSSNNMLPYAYLENYRVVEPPGPEIKFPVYDTEGHDAVVSVDYVSEEIDEVLYQRVRVWLDNHFAENDGKPFFIYFPMSAIHRPCLAREHFRDSTGAGLRGDKVAELDAIVGRLMRDLERHGVEDETLVVFTSDNGPRLGDVESILQEYAAEDWGKQYRTAGLLAHPDAAVHVPRPGFRWYTYGHRAAGPFYGFKGDIYEGGHRVPFLVRWPGRVQPGSVSEETICHTDVLATFAQIIGTELPRNAGEDSVSFLPVLRAQDPASPLREATVLDSWRGVKAVRQGPWKLILGEGSGGFANEIRGDAPVQLYNLDSDPQEQNNLHAEHPELVSRLRSLLERYQREGRSVQ